MSSKSALAQRLSIVAGFENPQATLEQYRTPPELAAHIVHTADLQDDVEGKRIVDLGTGTGMLALAAAFRGPERVIGVDVDPAPLQTARENRNRVATATQIDWIRADATRPPLAADDETTVIMNPPFGAQAGNEHADRAFLETAAEIASVSYSIHNEGSQEFVESFAADNDGEVTHAFKAEFDLPKQFDHHEEERRQIDAEVFRIDWD
jgi:putative methylase